MNTLGLYMKEEFEQNGLIDGETDGWMDGTGYIHNIIIVTGVLYRVEWMRSYHQITLDATEGDPMVWPHPRDVILYARSSY